MRSSHKLPQRLLPLLAVASAFILVPVTLAAAATVNVNLAGSGTVTSNPAGINCSDNGGSITGECSHEFGIFEAVDLTATGNTGSQLAEWSGNAEEPNTCDSGDENPCHFVNRFAAVTITADFASVVPQQILKVKLVGSGFGEVTSAPAGIKCGTTCEGPFGEDSTVILTATHNARSTFAAWRGCDSISTEGNCEVTMSAAKSVEAEFDAVPQQTLEVHKIGSGSGEVTSAPTGIECGATCTAPFNEGSTVILTATPAAAVPRARYTFAKWNGCSSVNGEGKCEATMSEAKTVEAEFNLIPQQTLKVEKTGSGSGEVTSSPSGINCGGTCEAEYDEGTTVTLTATPTSESFFAGWSGGACSGTGTCEVTVNTATTVIATFEPIPSPAATSGAASNVTATTARLEGAVNGQGYDTHYLVDYGETEAYGSEAPANSGVGEDAGVTATSTPVIVDLSGLTPNTKYYYKIVAYNIPCTFFCPPGGPNRAEGADRTFTTLPLAPSVSTDIPVSVGIATAAVGAEVIAQGADTTYHVEYGLTEALGGSTAPADGGSAASGRYVTVPLESLAPATTYYYRFAATNSGGEGHGDIRSFTTNATGEPSLTLPSGFSLTGVSPAGPAASSFPNLTGVTPIPPATVKKPAAPRCRRGRVRRYGKCVANGRKTKGKGRKR